MTLILCFPSVEPAITGGDRSVSSNITKKQTCSLRRVTSAIVPALAESSEWQGSRRQFH